MTQGQLDRENETQRISQILSALDPAVTGVRRDLRPFAQELAGQIDPALATALGLSTNTPVPPAAERLAQNRGLTIQPDGTAKDADGNVFAVYEEDGVQDWRPVSG
jgi:multidrug efflux pump subunit AcrB